MSNRRELAMVECHVYGIAVQVPKELVDLIQAQRERLRELEGEHERRLIEAWEAETGGAWADLQAQAARLPSALVRVS